MSPGRYFLVLSKTIVLIFLMTLLTLLCFLPLRLFAQLGLPRAQYLLLCFLGLIGLSFAAGLFRVRSADLEKEPTPPVHPADLINLRFNEQIYWTLPAPSHLKNPEFSELVESFEPWHGGDLLKFIKLFLIPDFTPAARIHHAAAEFSFGSIDNARRILDFALNNNPPPAVAIAKAELLHLTGDFIAAADLYHDVQFRFCFSLTPETCTVLKSRELRCRARAGDFEGTRIDCAEFLQDNPGDHSIYILDSLATLPLMYDFPDFIDEALSYNRQAIDLCPRLLSLKVTKGALLYEKREREEAKRILQHCLLETSDDYDRALCHFYLALIERKRGHLPEAKKLAEHVRSFSKEKWLLLRLRQEFAI